MGHSVWVIDQNRWVDTGDLTAGVRLRSAEDDNVELLGVRRYLQGHQRVYNLTVEAYTPTMQQSAATKLFLLIMLVDGLRGIRRSNSGNVV